MMNRILIAFLLLMFVACSPKNVNELVTNESQNLSDDEFNHLKARARSSSDFSDHKEIL